MILAEKIQNLRKKNNLSQEDLAEKLNVSRQSVSKWESAASIPDIGKILELAKLFGVTTDFLLKDDMETEEFTDTSEDEAATHRIVSLQEANDFLAAKEDEGLRIGIGVLLCILAPAVLILLDGLSLLNPRFPENVANVVGIVLLFACIAAAVAIFIFNGSRMERFAYLGDEHPEKFELEYGVAGVVQEKKSVALHNYPAIISSGVALCILSPVPLIAASFGGASNGVSAMLTALLLALAAIGVFFFIYSGSKKSAFDRLLRQGDFKYTSVETEKKSSWFSGFYWPLMTAVYLGWSFFSGRWDISWVVWPLAGLLYAALNAAINRKN